MFIGIDFGTSFSQSATVYNGSPLVLLGPAEYGIPSEFYYDSENGIQVGQDALDIAQGVNVGNLVSEIKMHLMEREPRTLDGRDFRNTEIMRHLFKKIVSCAVGIANSRLIDSEIQGAVLATPVSFGMQEKDQIQEAAKTCTSSPMKIMAIIKEPVAAAISYYKDALEDNKCILVFDLGGGTCDVALVKSDRRMRELFTVLDADMERIGGRDWDKAVTDYVVKQVLCKTGIDIKDEPRYMEAVKREVQKAKVRLSSPDTNVSKVRICMDGGRMVTITIGLGLFDEITQDLLEQSMQCLMRLYQRALADGYSIHEIICVGGSSNMLQVKRRIEELFPGYRIRVYQPAHAVVNGLAWYAKMIGDQPQPIPIPDIAGLSYGVLAYQRGSNTEKCIVNIIKMGQPVPATCEHPFRPHELGQSEVAFEVYESRNTEDTYAITEQMTKVGTLRFSPPRDYTEQYGMICFLTLKNDGYLYCKVIDDNGKYVPARFQLDKGIRAD